MIDENKPSAGDLDRIVEEQNTGAATQARPRLPICPYCLADPFMPLDVPINNAAGVTLLVVGCESCRKVVSTVILRIAQRPQVVPSRIIRPQ